MAHLRSLPRGTRQFSAPFFLIVTFLQTADVVSASKVPLLIGHSRPLEQGSTIVDPCSPLDVENAVPKTDRDVVLIYVSVVGRKSGTLTEENYVKKIYPQTIAGSPWSAIQVTTAAAVCSVVDLVLADPGHYQGFIQQETFPLSAVLSNRFGRVYA